MPGRDRERKRFFASEILGTRGIYPSELSGMLSFSIIGYPSLSEEFESDFLHREMRYGRARMEEVFQDD